MPWTLIPIAGFILILLPIGPVRALGFGLLSAAFLRSAFLSASRRIQPEGFRFRGSLKTALNPRGLMLPYQIFPGGKRWTGTLRQPAVPIPLTDLRTCQDAMLMSAALCLNADRSRHARILEQVLTDAHIRKEKIVRQYASPRTLDLRGALGTQVIAGNSLMGFFLLEDSQGEERLNFLRCCGEIRDGGRTRPLTPEDLNQLMLLPREAILLACAPMERVPTCLTLLGSLLLHETDVPSPEALDCVQSLQDSGFEVCYAQPGEGLYDPVQAMGLEIPPCHSPEGLYRAEVDCPVRDLPEAFALFLERVHGAARFLRVCLALNSVLFLLLLLEPPAWSGALGAFALVGGEILFLRTRLPLGKPFRLPSTLLLMGCTWLTAVFAFLLLRWVIPPETLSAASALSQGLCALSLALPFCLFLIPSWLRPLPLLCLLPALPALFSSMTPLQLLFAALTGMIPAMVTLLLFPCPSGTSAGPFWGIEDFRIGRFYLTDLMRRSGRRKTEEMEEEDTEDGGDENSPDTPASP